MGEAAPLSLAGEGFGLVRNRFATAAPISQAVTFDFKQSANLSRRDQFVDDGQHGVITVSMSDRDFCSTLFGSRDQPIRLGQRAAEWLFNI